MENPSPPPFGSQMLTYIGDASHSSDESCHIFEANADGWVRGWFVTDGHSTAPRIRAVPECELFEEERIEMFVVPYFTAWSKIDFQGVRHPLKFKMHDPLNFPFGLKGVVKIVKMPSI